MRPLVVVSDDAGFEAATDTTILECAARGVVRAASVFVCGGHWTSFVDDAQRQGLTTGLHLNLTEGEALSGPIPRLAPGGRFLGDKRAAWALLLSGEVSEEALEREIRAQWDALASRVGHMAFVNGHNHVHVAPVVANLLVELLDPAERTFVRLPFDHDRGGKPPAGLPRAFVDLADAARRCFADAPHLAGFAGNSFAHSATTESAVAPWREVAFASGEWMVHPGQRAGTAFTNSTFRESEVKCLCDPALPAEFAELGWAFARYEDFAPGGAYSAALGDA